jgi:hypothetical protein
MPKSNKNALICYFFKAFLTYFNGLIHGVRPLCLIRKRRITTAPLALSVPGGHTARKEYLLCSFLSCFLAEVIALVFYDYTK